MRNCLRLAALAGALLLSGCPGEDPAAGADSGTPTGADGATLAQELAAALTPQTWAALGADPEGRRRAAAG